MNCILINLTRFGDLLQSQAAIADLHEQGHSVSLVCLENFTDTAALLNHVDHVFPLPGAALLAHREDWPLALGTFTAWAQRIHDCCRPRRIYNITPTLPARLLAHALAQQCGLDIPPAPAGAGSAAAEQLSPVIGFGLDSFGFGVNSSPWASFLQGASRSRGVSPFNIADLFRKVTLGGGSPPRATLAPPGPEQCREAAELLAAHAPDGATGYIALQLGASEEKRRWPAEYFARSAEAIWQTTRLCPVLLGAANEKDLARDFAGHCPVPFIDLIGATSLPQLAATLLHCRLLISNDTGTLHLAAGLGKPVLGIFLATAQPWDTGPYRAGSCSVEPDMPCHPCTFTTHCPHRQCRTAIMPESIAHLVNGYCAHGAWPGMPQSAHARVWESIHDHDGSITLRSLSGHEHSTRTLWLREQRHFYRQFLDRNPHIPFTPSPPDSPLPLDDAGAKALHAELHQATSMLDALILQGELLLQRPLPSVQERFMAGWQRLNLLLEHSPHLSALSLLWVSDTQSSDQLAGTVALARHYADLLRAFLHRIPPLPEL